VEGKRGQTAIWLAEALHEILAARPQFEPHLSAQAKARLDHASTFVEDVLHGDLPGDTAAIRRIEVTLFNALEALPEKGVPEALWLTRICSLIDYKVVQARRAQAARHGWPGDLDDEIICPGSDTVN